MGYFDSESMASEYLSRMENMASVKRPVIQYGELTISRARNGFIVNPPTDSNDASGAEYVFSNFDSLTDWLREHLEGAE